MTHRPAQRRGIALIELLVVVSIVGALASFILPAVQSARESARRAHCANNLRQILLASQAYEAIFTVYPLVSSRPGAGPILREYSALSLLLPYLDQNGLFHGINFQVGMQDPYLFPPTLPLTLGREANSTYFDIGIEALACPSDPAAQLGEAGGTNYRCNLGAERWYDQVGRTGGPLGGFLPARTADIRDGLSQTAAFGERLRGRLDRSFLHPSTDLMIGGKGGGYTVDECLSECAGLPAWPGGFRSEAGLTWLVGSLAQTCYTHVHTPNSSVPDCIAIASPPPGLVGLRSYHPGGVHVGMSSGSVRFASSTIDRALWRAMGTRAGGEPLSVE